MKETAVSILFIVYNYSHEQCLATLESVVRPNEPVWEKVRVIYIPRDCEKESPELEAFLEENQKWITRFGAKDEKESDLNRAIKLAKDDSLICITQSGVVYNDGFMETLAASEGDPAKDMFVIPVAGANVPEYVQQMNRYCTQEPQNQNLEDTCELPCYGYYAYLFPKTMVPGAISREEEDILEIWKLLFKMTAQLDQVRALCKKGCRAKGLKNLPEFWNSVTEDETKSRSFCENFLQELFLWCSSVQHVKLSYARYNLLRFAMTFASYFSTKESADTDCRQIREWMEQFVEGLRDEKLIIQNTQIPRSYKYYFLTRGKMERSTDPEIEEKRRLLLNPDEYAAELLFTTLKEDSLTLEWRVNVFGEDAGQAYIQWKGKDYPAQRMKKEYEKYWFDVLAAKGVIFRCTIPLERGGTSNMEPIHLWNVTDGEKISDDKMTFGKFVPFDTLRFLYYEKDGWLFYYEHEKNCLYLEPATDRRRKQLLKRMNRSLWQDGGKSGKKAVLVQGVCRWLAKHLKKKIWLVSDRTNRGDDSGEALFMYLREHPVEDVQPYFVVSKDCEDYERMKKLGKVIDAMSWKHKMYHLVSEYEISSQANNPVVNPFGKYYKNYKNLMADRKTVFLQHGVMKDDLTRWLNRYNRNLRGLITTTIPEWQSVVDGDYYYTEKEIWRTGLPRYDRLYRDEKNYITIMPTWRKTLAAGTDAKGVWRVAEDFDKSEYFHFYDQLINSDRLLKAADRLGYKICFMPHPNVVQAISLFHKRPEVEFFAQDKSYREIFAQSSLILTDYSSVAFDFAYLGRPVVYAHFDYDEFFNGGHSYDQGYFDYVEDGFGEVLYNLEDTIDTLISYMERKCELKPKYLERINQTFIYRDRNCCQRVLDKILADRKE